MPESEVWCVGQTMGQKADKWEDGQKLTVPVQRSACRYLTVDEIKTLDTQWTMFSYIYIKQQASQ